MKPPAVSTLILYVRDMRKVADFYQAHFGFQRQGTDDDDSIHLVSPSGGCALMLMQASKGHKIGQSCIKLVFDVDDVESFKEKCAMQGLIFGVIHRGTSYEFANARDPAKNLIQISSRHFEKP